LSCALVVGLALGYWCGLRDEGRKRWPADGILDALAKRGGVIVSTGDLSEMLISIARANSDFYVNAEGLGFARLDRWNCPDDIEKQVTKE